MLAKAVFSPTLPGSPAARWLSPFSQLSCQLLASPSSPSSPCTASPSTPSLRRAVHCSAVSLGPAASSASGTSDAHHVDDAERRLLVNTYSNNGVRTQPGLVFEKGEGSYLYTNRGEKLLDFAAGIAVSVLGHGHPAWKKALVAQADKICHASNLFQSQPALDLAQRLVDNSPFDKVFFCNSGTEANEAAIKFALRYRGRSDPPQRSACLEPDFKGVCETVDGSCPCWGPPPSDRRIVACKSSFHGRSLGSLSLTHKPAIRYPFRSALLDVTFVEYNNISQLQDAVADDVAAVFVEPLQGEGGINPANNDFMHAVREACDAVDAVMVVDEVQCGLARTGHLWGFEQYGVKPDVMTLAKPLAGGLPIGATLVVDRVAEAIRPGDHGTTFGGNPLVTAVACAVFDEVSTPAFLADVREKGDMLRAGLQEMVEAYPEILSGVRGRGLLVGVQCTGSPSAVVAKALQQGLVVITAGTNTIRLAPPLTVSKSEVKDALELFEKSVASVAMDQVQLA